jgi:subtilisin family serine protease
MRYRDKSSNRTVVLSESGTSFLVVAQPHEKENLGPVLFDQKVFTVSPSTNDDGVFIIEARSDRESRAEIDKAVEKLKKDDRVFSIVPALNDQMGQTRFAMPDRVTVRFRGTKDPSAKKMLADRGSEVITSFGFGLYEASVPKSIQLPDFIDRLNEIPEIIFAEPSFYGFNDQEVRIDVASDTDLPRIHIDVSEGQPIPELSEDDQEDDQEDSIPGIENLGWNLKKLLVDQAWLRTAGKQDIIVAVIDGKPDVDHEAIAGKFFVPLSEEQFFTSDRSVSSHATQISGVVAGESNRLLGIAPGVRLLPLVVNLNSQVYAERASAILQAAEYARQKKIGDVPFSRMILCCSWRTRGDVAVIRTAMEEAVAADVVVVCSAGNDAVSTAHFPSDYSRNPGILSEGVIAVAATDIDDVKANYSNYSAAVDVSAPGGDGLPLDDGDIFCADQDGTYAFGAGTSLAAPHVAAVAALILSINPSLAAKDLKRIIKGTTDPIDSLNPGFEQLIGTGRVNAYKALVNVNAPSNNGTSSEIPTVRAALNQYSLELEQTTGWKLNLARVTKEGSSVDLDLS